MSEFVPFRKIPRLSRDIIVTEKIDGTNAQVHIQYIRNKQSTLDSYIERNIPIVKNGDFNYAIIPGSKNRELSPGKKDNYGFASWVREHAKELICLGPGIHYGEWWGEGLQRKYNLNEKRFSLFDVDLWEDNPMLPKCCHVVPVLGRLDVMDTDYIDNILEDLTQHGSYAAPGFMSPEGVIIYHKASGQLFKRTIENDGKPKGGQR